VEHFRGRNIFGRTSRRHEHGAALALMFWNGSTAMKGFWGCSRVWEVRSRIATVLRGISLSTSPATESSVQRIASETDIAVRR
jgi:hypothetical protein